MFDWFLAFFGLCRLSEFDSIEKDFRKVSKQNIDMTNVFWDNLKLSNNYLIKVYKDTAGEFRWKILSKNNKIMADSGEGYKTRRALHKSLETLRKVFYSVPLEEEE